jgi:hypothetical protein
MARQVNQTHENYSVFDQGVGGGGQSPGSFPFEVHTGKGATSHKYFTYIVFKTADPTDDGMQT